LWISAATIPAIAAGLRVASGRHFPTDVLTGYAVGALVGYYIPELHKKKTQNISMVPFFYDGGMGMTFTFKLNGTKPLSAKIRSQVK